MLWLSPVVFFLFALFAILRGGKRKKTALAMDEEQAQLVARALAMLEGREAFDAERLRAQKGAASNPKGGD